MTWLTCILQNEACIRDDLYDYWKNLGNVWSSVGWLPTDVSSREFFKPWKDLRLSRPGLVLWKGILMIPLSGIELWRRPVLLMHLSWLKFWEPQKSSNINCSNSCSCNEPHQSCTWFGVFLPLICWSLDPQAWSSCGGLVPSKGWQWI